MAKSFLNAPETLVTDALQGFLLTQPGLTRLDGFPVRRCSI